MSGLFFVRRHDGNDLNTIAKRICAQLSHGDEIINHYAISGGAVFGMVSHDKLSQGLMPRYFKEEKLWGLLLGQLYDCEQLGRLKKDYPSVDNDLEFFVKLYKDDGFKQILPNLNGAYAAVLWDVEKQLLIIANDRYGLYPLYWSCNTEGFCISSRVLASVIAGTVDGEWNLGGVMQMLSIDDLLDKTTLIKGVNAFPQASLLYEAKGEFTWHQYWHLDYSKKIEIDAPREIAKELGARFIQAINRQTDRHQDIGVTLSGGLDSRTIVAGAAASQIPVKTFTWGKNNSYDRSFAKHVSQTYDTEHFDCDYQFQNFESHFKAGIRATEGQLNYFDAHMLAHLDILQKNTNLVLNGYAGDLVLGGSYLRSAWKKPVPVDHFAKIIFRWRNTNVPETSLDMAMPMVSDIAYSKKPSEMYKQLFLELENMMPYDLVERFFLENRVRRQCAMGTVLIRCVTESAAPFFDYDLLDLTIGIPADWRYEHKIYLLMLKEVFPEALGIRWQRTLLPASAPQWTNLPTKAIIKGCRILEEKLGWPHIASRQSPVAFSAWLRGPLHDWVHWLLCDPHPNADAILKADFCRKIYERHMKGEDMTRLIGVIAALRGIAEILSDVCNQKSPPLKSATEIHI